MSRPGSVCAACNGGGELRQDSTAQHSTKHSTTTAKFISSNRPSYLSCGFRHPITGLEVHCSATNHTPAQDSTSHLPHRKSCQPSSILSLLHIPSQHQPTFQWLPPLPRGAPALARTPATSPTCWTRQVLLLAVQLAGSNCTLVRTGRFFARQT
jgi:hypothetical protein